MDKSALYLISLGAKRDPICFYSPYYGDPESVADRFFKLHLSCTFACGDAMEFFKANPELEFARDPDMRTDYHYVLDSEGQLSVLRPKASECLFEGAWYSFVNTYGSQEFLHLFEVPGFEQKRVMRLSQAKQWVQDLRQAYEERGAEQSTLAEDIALEIQRIESSRIIFLKRGD
jgi:hypothetical protein